MLQIAFIVGLILGFLLRGWLESTWIGRLFRKRKDDDQGRPGGPSKPRSLFDRASTFLLDGVFKPKRKDDNDKNGGKK